MTDAEVSNLMNVMFVSAPPDELYDARRRYLSHFQDPSLVRKMVNVLPSGPVEAIPWLSKLERASEKAIKVGSEAMYGNPRHRQTVDYDPYNNGYEVPGMRSKRNKSNGWMLRIAADSNPIITAILANFKNQSLGYANPFRLHHSAILSQVEGFDIVRRGRPFHERLPDSEEAERQYLIDFIRNSGDADFWSSDNSPTAQMLQRDPFESVLEQMVHDRFVLDAVAIERNWSLDGRTMRGIYVVDGATIWLPVPPGEPNYALREVKDPKYVYTQVMNNEPVRWLDSNELAYFSVNKRPGLHYNHYGISEVESTHKLTVGILNVLTMTNAHFDRATLPEGMLVLSGFINNDALSLFRDEYVAYREDPGGGLGVPLLSFRDPQSKATWLPMHKNPKDLEHSQYASLLIALTCSQFGIDVVEINASAFGGQNAGLNSGKDTVARHDASRSRGWLPWMAQAARMFNRIYAPLFGRKWEFIWRGLEKYDAEWLGKLYTAVHGPDEVRQGFFGSPPLGGVIGIVPAQNPALAQMALNAARDGVDLGGQLTTAMNEVGDGVGKRTEQEAGSEKPGPNTSSFRRPTQRKKALIKALLKALAEEEDEDDDGDGDDNGAEDK